MELETILLGITGTLAVYVAVEHERTAHINEVTTFLIFDSCYSRNNNSPLNLPPKESFLVLGLDTYRAVNRYEKVYAALQEKGDTVDSRELEKLFDVK